MIVKSNRYQIHSKKFSFFLFLPNTFEPLLTDTSCRQAPLVLTGGLLVEEIDYILNLITCTHKICGD